MSDLMECSHELTFIFLTTVNSVHLLQVRGAGNKAQLSSLVC